MREEGPIATQQGGEHIPHWSMVIDLDLCTGCGACSVACFAENNIAVVGEDEMATHRALHWIRIERYWRGDYPNVEAPLIPLLCQQCANAPCEPVCPVFASVHSSDGLNLQVYNRCIGTRFCGNNCPYKVRVFNFFRPEFDPPLEQQLNPDVTVRGIVMEKCTFCVQRIRRAREEARAEGRQMVDGDVQPACAQTCPTGAIVFGDANDPRSQVARLLRRPAWRASAGIPRYAAGDPLPEPGGRSWLSGPAGRNRPPTAALWTHATSAARPSPGNWKGTTAAWTPSCWATCARSTWASCCWCCRCCCWSRPAS